MCGCLCARVYVWVRVRGIATLGDFVGSLHTHTRTHAHIHTRTHTGRQTDKTQSDLGHGSVAQFNALGKGDLGSTQKGKPFGFGLT